MRYEYDIDLRFGELLRFQCYMLLVRMRLGFFVFLWLLAGLYMTAQLVSGEVSLSESTKGFAIAFGLPFFLIVVTIVGTYRAFNQVWKPRLPIRFSFDSAGISTSMPSIASQIQWSGIEETKSWGGLLLLFINRHCALIIPMRCLGEQREVFREYIEHHLKGTG